MFDARVVIGYAVKQKRPASVVSTNWPTDNPSEAGHRLQAMIPQARTLVQPGGAPFCMAAATWEAAMVREVLAMLWDAVQCGDWRGHLSAWLAVATGSVTAETRSGRPM